MEIHEALRHYIINEGLKNQIPEGFGDDYNLIESGIIDSLFMMSLITYLEQQYQIEFGMNDMVPKHFKSVNTLAEFARNKLETLMGSRTTSESDFSKIGVVSRTQQLPLSFLQEEIWHSCRVPAKLLFWSRLNILNLSGQLKPKSLANSFTLLAQRHEILRTTFPLKKGVPVLHIATDYHARMQVIDLSFMPEAEQSAEVALLLEQEKQQSLDLMNGPTWRVKLIRLSDDVHILLIYIHHLIMDAASMDILCRELFALYASEIKGKTSMLPDLPLQFADFGHWQRTLYTAEKLQQQLNYYQQFLSPEPPRLNFINAKAGTTEGDIFPSDFEALQLSPELLSGLKKLGQQSGATLFTTLLSALLVLLHRYTNSEDILIAVPMSKRFHSGLDLLIGDFSGEIIIRAAVDSPIDFSALLNATQQAVQSSISNQELSYQQVSHALAMEQEEITMPHQVMLNFIPKLAQEIHSEGISASCSIEQTVRNKMFLDLAVRLWEESSEQGDILKGGFRYRTDLFAASSIIQMINDFTTLITAVVENPKLLISDIKLSI